MSKAVDIVHRVACKMRPDLFSYNEKNELAVPIGMKIRHMETEQRRVKAVIRDVLLETEHLGYRVVDPKDLLTVEMVKHVSTLRQKGASLQDVLFSAISKIPTIFPQGKLDRRSVKKCFGS